MEFVFIISHGPEFRPTPALFDAVSTWIETQTQAGFRIDGRPLVSPDLGQVVRIRDGNVYKSAGPATRAAEQVCAYELYRCPSIDHAIALAVQHPMAAVATIDVRPVWTELAAG